MQAWRRLTQLLGILVVAACVACPIFEMFDHWDHTARTGKDTESTLLVVALSVGLMFPATGIVALPHPGAAVFARSPRSFLPHLMPVRVDALEAMSNSPPPLRI